MNDSEKFPVNPLPHSAKAAERTPSLPAQQEAYVQQYQQALQFERELLAASKEMVFDLEQTVRGLEAANDPSAPEAKSILQRFRDIASEEVRAFALTAAILFPAPAFTQETTAAATGADTELVAESASSSFENRLQELQERVWTDDHETLYLFFGRAGEMTEIMSVQGEAGAGHVLPDQRDHAVAASKIREMVAAESALDQIGHTLSGKRFTQTMLHNHPMKMLQQLYSIDDATKEAMQTGTQPSIVAPPGLVDVHMSMKTDAWIDYIHYVAEPSGVWKLDPDEQHEYMSVIRESTRQITSAMSQIAKEHSGTKEERLEEIISVTTQLEDKMKAELGAEYHFAISQLTAVAEAIRYGSLDGQNVEDLIERYIAIAKDLGIEVTYTNRNE